MQLSKQPLLLSPYLLKQRWVHKMLLSFWYGIPAAAGFRRERAMRERAIKERAIVIERGWKRRKVAGK